MESTIHNPIRQNLTLIELHVGYSSPDLLIEEDSRKKPPTHHSEEHEIYFNFHLTINGFNWYEMIEYRFLYDLNSNIIPSGETEDTLLTTFPNFSQEEFATLHKMLKLHDYDEGTIRVLQSNLRAMETWAYALLCNLHKIDEESRQMTKQLFFRSEEKLVKYEHLLKLLKNRQYLEEQERNEASSGINYVFRAMTSLFSLKPSMPSTASALSERNLQKHTKQQESRDFADPSAPSVGKGGGGGAAEDLMAAKPKKTHFHFRKINRIKICTR